MDKSVSSARKRIRVLIVDDHVMVCLGLRTFLEMQDAFALPIEVVGEAVHDVQAVELAHKTQPISSC